MRLWDLWASLQVVKLSTSLSTLKTFPPTHFLNQPQRNSDSTDGQWLYFIGATAVTTLLEFCGPPQYASLSRTHSNYLVTGLDLCVEHNWLHRGWLAQNITGSIIPNEEGCELVSSCCHTLNTNPHVSADTGSEVEMRALITAHHPISSW